MSAQRFSPILRLLHHADYAWLLPFMAQLPLGVGYLLARWRGEINARLGRDWRSMALGTRHVLRQSVKGYRMLFPQATEQALYRLAQERFRAESLEEFEGRLIAASRVPELVGEIEPAAFAETCKQRDRGLLLLAPHFDSFWLGTVFLGLAGIKVHAMTSRVIHHVSVIPAVQRHFVDKYRAMETYMNGGRMLHAEDGLRPFYQILEKGECLVILADAPAVAAGAVVTPCFLGHRRQMAGGAVRLARKTGCDLGAFVCRYQKPGRYLVKGGPIMPASDPQALDTIYCFLSDEIMADPGRWCATDLLPLMKPVDTKENC